MTSEGNLLIKNAVPKDAGIYGCLASNSAGMDKQTSTLASIISLKASSNRMNIISSNVRVLFKKLILGMSHIQLYNFLFVSHTD